MLVSRRKKRRNYFKTVYKREEDTGAYIIEIDLDLYEDVFNEWDHAPFRRRDIDPDLKNYMEECSDEIPLKYPIVFYFFVPTSEKHIEKEDMVKKGVKNYFTSYIMLLEKNMENAQRNVVLYLIPGIIFFIVAIMFEKIFKANIISKVLLEGIFIGGWVLFWEVFDLLFIRYRILKKEKKEYERFTKSEIKFIYAKKDMDSPTGL